MLNIIRAEGFDCIVGRCNCDFVSDPGGVKTSSAGISSIGSVITIIIVFSHSPAFSAIFWNVIDPLILSCWHFLPWTFCSTIRVGIWKDVGLFGFRSCWWWWKWYLGWTRVGIVLILWNTCCSRCAIWSLICCPFITCCWSIICQRLLSWNRNKLVIQTSGILIGKW